jgi:hypothetical protein
MGLYRMMCFDRPADRARCSWMIRSSRVTFFFFTTSYKFFTHLLHSSPSRTMWNQLRMTYQSLERLYNQLSPDIQTPVKCVVLALSVTLMNFLLQEIKRGNSGRLLPFLQNNWADFASQVYLALKMLHYLRENNVLMLD